MKNILKTIGKTYFRARGYYSAEICGKHYKLDPYHIAFWRAAAQGRWENTTFEVLEKYLKPTSTYVDIGAWIGPTVLHASRFCDRVYCFEPDPTAYRFLNWNIDLNNITNVSSFGVAIAAQAGIFKMATFGDNRGDSMTSLLQTESDYYIHALAISWAEFSTKVDLKNLDLIKIDIEGAEFDLIPTMSEFLKKQRPTLFLSTHSPYLDEPDRQQSMQKLWDSLSCYSWVYDEFLNPVHEKDFISKAASEKFNTYLFTNE